MTGKAIQLTEEGKYLAKVEVTLSEAASPWGAVVRNEDLCKLDRVRMALRRGDSDAARREAKVFELKPLAAE